MYATLIAKIKNTLAQVSEVKDYFSIPKTRLTKYPCVYFKPLSLDNSFETVSENKAVYQFRMYVIAAKAQTTIENLMDNILPNTIDAIIEQFDQDWNYGTVDGHRVVARISSADEWVVSEEQDGIVAYAPMVIEITLLTDN